MVKPVPGPDGLEKGIRLGCGALFGLLLGVVVLVPPLLRMNVSWATYLLIGLPAVLFAWLARKYGDDFWSRVAGILRPLSQLWPW